MIRMLEDLTGIDAEKDPHWMIRLLCHCLRRQQALGITPDDIGGCQLGLSRNSGVRNGISQSRCFWIRSRKYFSDLVRIAGLAHGTDVWLGNAQTLHRGGLRPQFPQRSVRETIS